MQSSACSDSSERCEVNSPEAKTSALLSAVERAVGGDAPVGATHVEAALLFLANEPDLIPAAQSNVAMTPAQKLRMAA